MIEGIIGVSTFANDIDRAFWVVTILCLFLFIVTIGTMLFFAYKYSQKRNPPEKTKNIKHYTPIELAWTIIPTILLMIMFYYGLNALRVQRTMPNDENSIVIKVLAKRWSWSFEYPNGVKSPTLYVPVNKNIKLLMTAPKDDVIHSFYVPAFRIKEDVVPAQTTKLWFNATTIGKYDIECTEYCGTRHSYMLSKVLVIDNEEYETWQKNKTSKPGEVIEKIVKSRGLELIEQNGCFACHSQDGSILVGPSFKNIYKPQLGKEYYLNAILNPNKDIAEGFSAGIMPTFNYLKKEELDAIIETLQDLK